MPADDTPAGDLDEAERLVRQFAETGQHPGRPAVAAVLAEYDRRAQEIEQLAYERDGALARVAAAEAVQSRMADSLPDQGPWQAWSERDRAVRDYEGELSTALSTEIDPAADRRIEAERQRDVLSSLLRGMARRVGTLRGNGRHITAIVENMQQRLDTALIECDDLRSQLSDVDRLRRNHDALADAYIGSREALDQARSTSREAISNRDSAVNRLLGKVAAVRELCRDRYALEYGGRRSVDVSDVLAVLDGLAEAPEVVRQDDTETTRTTSGDQRHDVYVRISDNPVSRTREVFDGLNVDFDSSGAAVGVEVLGSPYRGVTVDGLWAAPIEGVEYVNPSCIECGGEGGPCCEHPDLIGTASPEAQAAWLAGPAEAPAINDAFGTTCAECGEAITDEQPSIGESHDGPLHEGCGEPCVCDTEFTCLAHDHDDEPVSAGPAEAAEPAPDLYEPGAPLCGCNECEQVRQDTGVEELTDQLRAFHRKAAGSVSTTPTQPTWPGTHDEDDSLVADLDRALVSIQRVRTAIDEGGIRCGRGHYTAHDDVVGDPNSPRWRCSHCVRVEHDTAAGSVSTTPDPDALDEGRDLLRRAVVELRDRLRAGTFTPADMTLAEDIAAALSGSPQPGDPQ